MRDAFEQLCEQASTPLREAADEHGLSDSAALARLGPPYEKDLHPQSSDWERRLHMFYDENRAELCERVLSKTSGVEGLDQITPLQRHAILLFRSMQHETLFCLRG
jgi:hypothetical protein